MKLSLTFLMYFMTTMMAHSQTDYPFSSDSQIHENVPVGKITKHSWKSSIYVNTQRDYYLSIPVQYDGSKPAALMIFQDGHAYVNKDGDFRAPVVFDNLIHQGKMPVTIGLFINPGHDLDANPPESPWRVTNRSVEYDEVSPQYADFLLKEIIPQIKEMGLNISEDPKMRAICGMSSGGICSFTAAWFYPDQFHKFLSHIGSFTDIRGGHHYPRMIRKNEKKEIKIFLQDGSNDLNNKFGNWWLANLQMESALKFKEYDYKFVGGDGEHNGKHGGAILPESLTWLWSDVINP